MNWLIDIDGLVKIDTPEMQGGKKRKKNKPETFLHLSESKKSFNNFELVLSTNYFDRYLIKIDNS